MKIFRKKVHKNIGCYPINLHIIDTNDSDKLYDVYGFREDDIYAVTTRGHTMRNGREYHIVLIIFNDNSAYGRIKNSDIAHEAFHAMNFVFDYIGESGKCEEPRAYLISEIYEKVEKFLNEKR
jgi:hypothetical protein